MIAIPDSFAAEIENGKGEPGRNWLASLPSVIGDLCHRWRLVIDGQPRHGHLAIVVPVRRDAELCALKVSWQDADTIHEAHALRLWNGRDSVRVIEYSPDYGALLLEWLDPQRTLLDLPLDAAIRVAGEMMRNLAIPGDATLPTAAGIAAEIAHTLPDQWEDLGRPIPRRLIDETVALATALPGSPVTTMVNWDLHYGNVLFSTTRQRWVAVDPKPAVGVLESGVAQLFWTRITDITSRQEFNRYLTILIDTAGLDPDQTRAWLRVRVVSFWLWELSVGLTDDPGGCATIIDWLGEA